MEKKIKAISLLSGGLDSAIATKLVMDQGIECIAVNFTSPFCTCNYKGRCHSKEIAENLGIEYITVSKGEKYLDIVRNPRFGYGQGLNPCIDCKIFILDIARKMLDECNASFVITGEVLGQRPMSQHKRALELIEKESKLEGRILRPLSANLLSETTAEKNGWINRNKLLNILGRSRKEQLKLAQNFNIKTFACAAGGCLLTDKKFAIKIKDLFEHSQNINYRDVSFLKVGRHFRYNENKIIIGRNKTENEQLLSLKSDNDLIFEVPDYGSPVTVLQNKPSSDAVILAAELTAFYSDCKKNAVKVKYYDKLNMNEIDVKLIDEELSKKFNLAFKKFENNKKIVDMIK